MKELLNPLNVIPVITHPLGISWKQPKLDQIEIDDTHALMSKKTFDELLEFSWSEPTAVYEGKMWKTKTIDGWVLRWYSENSDKYYCSNNARLILFL